MNSRIIDFHTHIYPTTLARRAMAVAGREHDDFEKLPVKENLGSGWRKNISHCQWFTM